MNMKQPFFSIFHAMIISYNKEKNLVVWTEKLLLFYCSSDERISENSVHLQMLNAKIHTMYRVQKMHCIQCRRCTVKSVKHALYTQSLEDALYKVQKMHCIQYVCTVWKMHCIEYRRYIVYKVQKMHCTYTVQKIHRIKCIRCTVYILYVQCGRCTAQSVEDTPYIKCRRCTVYCTSMYEYTYSVEDALYMYCTVRVCTSTLTAQKMHCILYVRVQCIRCTVWRIEEYIFTFLKLKCEVQL